MYSRNTQAERRRNPHTRLYLVYRNDKSANNGGILIGVRDNIQNINLKLTQEDKVCQSPWILVTSTKKRLE